MNKCSAVTYGITMALLQHALKLGKYRPNCPATLGWCMARSNSDKVRIVLRL